MKKTIIIAEIGECYNGEMKTAKKMMKVAKDTKCNVVKFQTLDFANISEDDPEKEWFKKIALDPEKISYLIDYARSIDISILFTPENTKTAEWLVKNGLDDVKIASSSITDLSLLEYINENFSKVYISTGMASLDEVYHAVDCLKDIKDVYIMHCVSEYPTGPLLEQRGLQALAHENVNMNMMRILKQLFPQHKIGYSDHTNGILAPIVAVAMGAEVIEKHITLNKEIPIKNYKIGKEYKGTDHVLSIEPHLLNEMVCQIREVERIIGDWKWKRSEGEILLKNFLRKRFILENE